MLIESRGSPLGVGSWALVGRSIVPQPECRTGNGCQFCYLFPRLRLKVTLSTSVMEKNVVERVQLHGVGGVQDMGGGGARGDRLV